MFNYEIKSLDPVIVIVIVTHPDLALEAGRLTI